MPDTSTCSDCGFTPRPNDTRTDRPMLITLLCGDDEPLHVCSLCIFKPLARLEWDGQATVSLSRQFADQVGMTPQT